MNLKDLLQHFKEELMHLYDEQEAAALFELVVKHVSGFNSRELKLKGISTQAADEFAYLSMLSELKSGKPLQYVIGETEFYGFRFRVDRNVLIPRPETEELVDWIIADCKGNTGLRIVDIGTGSGCIAIALSKKIVDSVVTAVDVSEEALNIASKNAGLNAAELRLLKADILDSNRWDEIASGGKFDVVVSNPPYITENEKEEMHRNVLEHEPHLALFVTQEKPLVFYEAIADFARLHLKTGGLLFFEINEHLGKETVQMLRDKSFKDIWLRKDINGKDRMVKCRMAD